MKNLSLSQTSPRKDEHDGLDFAANGEASGPSANRERTKPAGEPIRTPASHKKGASNRRNALKSTGPKTDVGKRAVRYNALKHGFLARATVVSEGAAYEDPEKFNALVIRLRKLYQPVEVLEESQVEQIAICLWRKRRALTYENASIGRGTLVQTKYLESLGTFREEGEPDRSTNDWRLLIWLLERAHSEVQKTSCVSEETRNHLLMLCRDEESIVALFCRESQPESQDAPSPPTEATPTEMLEVFGNLLETYRIFRQFAEYRERRLNELAAGLSAVPSNPCFLRYEAHNDRQLERAMLQLERLQNNRKAATDLQGVEHLLSKQSQ